MGITTKLLIFLGLILFAVILGVSAYFINKRFMYRKVKEDLFGRLQKVIVFSFIVLGIASMVSSIMIFI